MPLFAGIDGGGSKTLAVVVNEKGEEVGRGLASNANYQVLVTQGNSPAQAAALAVTRVVEAINKALPIGSAGPIPVLAGLAGIDRPDDIDLMRVALTETGLCDPTLLEINNDADLLLWGLEDGVGVGLVAGTGSIAVGRDKDGHKARAGGWGYIFGDEGSGYDLGRTALGVAAMAADLRGPTTTLLPLILKEWQLAQPEELIEAVYASAEGRNAKIARLANLVFEAARSGDAIAQSLVQKAIDDLARTVWAVYKQLDFETQNFTPALSLGGGLVLNTPELKTGILNQLDNFGVKLSKVVDVPDPALAAALACLHTCLHTKRK